MLIGSIWWKKIEWSSNLLLLKIYFADTSLNTRLGKVEWHSTDLSESQCYSQIWIMLRWGKQFYIGTLFLIHMRKLVKLGWLSLIGKIRLDFIDRVGSSTKPKPERAILGNLPKRNSSLWNGKDLWSKFYTSIYSLNQLEHTGKYFKNKPKNPQNVLYLPGNVYGWLDRKMWPTLEHGMNSNLPPHIQT